MPEVINWHDQSAANHLQLRTEAYENGYRFISLSIYGPVEAPLYAAVMLQPDAPYDQFVYDALTPVELETVLETDVQQQGLSWVIVAATGGPDNPLFAAVLEMRDPPTIMTMVTPAATFDMVDLNADAKLGGAILIWAASWGNAANPCYLGIWGPNNSNTLWNNEGLAESVDAFQQRFDAQLSAWCVPSFITLNGDNEYLSLFVASEYGPLYVQHDMTSDEYQNVLDAQISQGLVPICVQAATTNDLFFPNRFAAIFAGSPFPLPRQFTAHWQPDWWSARDFLSPQIPNAQIDATVAAIMTDYPTVRHASLAIVYQKKLVYASGYALAEADWPIVHPETFFRLASVSKTVTALAVYALIHQGLLKLSDTMQGILQLLTPPLALVVPQIRLPPTDPNFSLITVQHLLEHTSGLDPDALQNGAAPNQAFGEPLPTTMDQMDAFIASLHLKFAPGTQQRYCNTGYYLLGRIVAKVSNESTPVEAYQTLVFNPLSISRMRGAVDLVDEQLGDEARYQARDLTLGWSLQTEDQPLVPAGYGDDQLFIGQADGGLSAATVDLARLLAIFLNPANALSTPFDVADLLANAAQTYTTQMAVPNNSDPRAGYGLDAVSQHLDDGTYYGQKGGSLPNAAAVLKFDREWGIVLCFGSPAQLADGSSVSGWYPNCGPIMDIATTINWTKDLWPDFGMPAIP